VSCCSNCRAKIAAIALSLSEEMSRSTCTGSR
jgi:hypothetical protein